MSDTKTMGKKCCRETFEVKLLMILSAMLHESLHPKFSMNAFDDQP